MTSIIIFLESVSMMIQIASVLQDHIHPCWSPHLCGSWLRLYRCGGEGRTGAQTVLRRLHWLPTPDEDQKRQKQVSLWGRWWAVEVLRYWTVIFLLRYSCFTFFVPTYNNDGLVQDCSNSIANVLELMQSCTKPLASFPVCNEDMVILHWTISFVCITLRKGRIFFIWLQHYQMWRIFLMLLISDMHTVNWIYFNHCMKTSVQLFSNHHVLKKNYIRN